MAQPTEPLYILATEELGADGYTNKEKPEGTVASVGFSKQSLSYQAMNYLNNNQADWIRWIKEEQVPDEVAAIQAQIDTINDTTIPTETSARENADTALAGDIATEANLRSSADVVLSGRVSTLETDALTVADFSWTGATNGYQISPTGIIMQWGLVQTGVLGGSGIYSPFPIAFPTDCFVVTATHLGAAESVNVIVETQSQVGVTLKSDFTDPETPLAYYIAIGA